MAAQDSDLAHDLRDLGVRIERLEGNIKLSILRIAATFLGSAIAVLGGLGYFYISVTTKDIFHTEGQSVLRELNVQNDETLRELRNDSSWHTYHNNGVRYRSTLGKFDAKEALQRAIGSFEDALKYQRRGATYWELAQLRYFIPRNNGLDQLVDADQALQDLSMAALLYTPEECQKGWLGDAYFDMAEIISDQLAKTRDPNKIEELVRREKAKLNKACEEYSKLDVQNKPWIADRLATITERLSEPLGSS